MVTRLRFQELLLELINFKFADITQLTQMALGLVLASPLFTATTPVQTSNNYLSKGIET
jgi:hypothetical protein